MATSAAAGIGRYGSGMAQQRRKRRRAQRRTGGTWAQLAARCQELDGAGYGAYKQLAGSYHDEGGQWQIAVDHVQADPFAAPSKVRVIVPRAELDLASEFTASRLDRVAVSDSLAREVAAYLAGTYRAGAGSGKSNTISIGELGQEVIERTNVLVARDRIEFRLLVGLPARGRRVLGRQAATLLVDEVVAAVAAGMRTEGAALERAVWLLRDQEALRAALPERSLVAFVADGAMLARRSGASDLPLPDGVPFRSPKSLREKFVLPSGRRIKGMGVPEGVTVIVGGGYHGKSTLLRALERGVYAHTLGDGREFALTRADATAVRAEDGRPVTAQDISPFITNLPSGAGTTRFSTTNASGSTSQAANVIEALQAGASALLIDEDTSATNFMLRDSVMSQLIADDREPIMPLSARVRGLYVRHGVSTVLVAGGSGAFLGLADTVIAMDAYVPANVTVRAHEIGRGHAPEQLPVSAEMFGPDVRRLAGPQFASGPKPPKARGGEVITVGKSAIDLRSLSQLAGAPQVAAIALALKRLDALADDGALLADVADALCEELAAGLEALAPGRAHPGHLALPRRFEILAAVNRFRNLRVE